MRIRPIDATAFPTSTETTLHQVWPRAGLVRQVLRDVAAPLLLSRLLLILVTLSAPLWRFTVPDPGRFLSPNAPIGGVPLSRWYHWDAVWYLRVAGNGPQMGYSRYTENASHSYGAFAFFPLFPLAVRAAALAIPGALDTVPAGGTVRPQLLVAALLVANLAFVLALLALYALLSARAGPDAGRRAIWLLCLFPTTVFFSAPYSESLFFLWIVLFFLALDRHRWWIAGLCGALAAATRSLGAALVVPYLVCAWQQRRPPVTPSPPAPLPQGARGAPGRRSPSPAHRERRAGPVPPRGPLGIPVSHGVGGEGPFSCENEMALPRRHGDTESTKRGFSWITSAWWMRLAPAALIPLGLVAYMAYLTVAWGDPLLFQKAEKAWGRTLAAPWTGIIDGLTWSLRAWPHLPQQNWRGLTDALYAVVFLGLTALAWRATDWAGRAYALVFWLYVLCAPQISDPRYPDTLISMARFLLVLLPLWLWLAQSRRRTLLMALPSAVLLLFYAARWVNAGWIG